jgi:hypothetical protein
MSEMHSPKSDALRALYWRSEILQVMYWLRGEGLGDVVDPELIERFLGVDAAVGVSYLDRMVAEGYVERTDAGYSLTAWGLEEGSTEFAAAFADLTGPTHGDCSPNCWCKVSVEEAEACAAERAASSA